MLVALTALGGGAFFVASWVVSVRLLLLARRTRGLPEALVATGLLLLGAIGYPLAIAVPMSAEQPSLQTAFMIAHALLQALGQGAIATFTWRVFRPDVGWARALVGGCLCGMAGLAAWQTAGAGWHSFAVTQQGPWSYLSVFTLIALGWAGAEALLYHRKLALRLALGLADAVSADRIRLWSISILSAFAISALVSGMRAAGHTLDPREMGIFLGPLGIVSAGSMWLAFLPPARYLRWVEARTRGAA
jgi:hypothetical protein